MTGVPPAGPSRVARNVSPSRANVSSSGTTPVAVVELIRGVARRRRWRTTSDPVRRRVRRRLRRSARHRDRRVRRWRRRVQSRSCAIPAMTAPEPGPSAASSGRTSGPSGGRAVPAVLQATSTRRAPTALQAALSCRPVVWAPEVGRQCPQATTDHTDLPVSVCSHPQLSLSSATIRNPYPPEAIGRAARRTRGMA